MSTTSDIDATARAAGDKPEATGPAEVGAEATRQESTKGSVPSKDAADPEGSGPVLTKDSERPDAETGAAATDPAASAPGISRWTVLRMVAVALIRKFAVPALIILAVAALAFAGFLGRQLKKENALDSAAHAATDAARTYAVTLTSVDSNNLDHDFTAVLDGATGEFKDMYTRSSGRLRQLLMDNKATGEGTVLDAAVKSATPTKVEVLLFIDQTVTNAAAPDPRVDRSRVAMTMELVDGRWLASRVYLP
ncbi:hypothetical protein ACH474_24920 [Nocardia rhamnosiphila]|uniref:hypothetical protein n=1 Tax=Nocardia rhamnosiphila TaxID=426716 RepID=UPI000ACA2807|nr:hypothetical protein [Nocardia rhamnosiphila]